MTVARSQITVEITVNNRAFLYVRAYPLPPQILVKHLAHIVYTNSSRTGVAFKVCSWEPGWDVTHCCEYSQRQGYMKPEKFQKVLTEWEEVNRHESWILVQDNRFYNIFGHDHVWIVGGLHQMAVSD